MTTTDKFVFAAIGIKPVSTRQAAQLLDCSQRHVEPWLACKHVEFDRV